jgi:hypothetical protein
LFTEFHVEDLIVDNKFMDNTGEPSNTIGLACEAAKGKATYRD